MSGHCFDDPYNGNPLITPLGPMRDRGSAARTLMYLPAYPKHMSELPVHIRGNYLEQVRDIHIPTHAGVRIHERIDKMIRYGYRYRDPRHAGTWRGNREGFAGIGLSDMSPAIMTVSGHSGTGKTVALKRTLQSYKQIVLHDNFPSIRGKHYQVTWLSVDVPHSGRLVDLVANLMFAWDRMLGKSNLDLPPRFEGAIPKQSSGIARSTNEWLAVALGHFLGVLHFDEVQNFFKIGALENRRKRSGKNVGMELSIAEDACLKWVLTLSNTWGIPVIFSGTPDGVAALLNRMSTAQRGTTFGYYEIRRFENIEEKGFDNLMDTLSKYQYLAKPLPLTDELRRAVLESSGGIHRIIMTLWISAQEIALERPDDELKLSDFKEASETLLEPVAPAIAALRSNDPKRMACYEDMVSGALGFLGTPDK